MYEVVLLSQAERDIAQAVIWYNKQQRGLGIRFREQLYKKLNLIGKYPKGSPLRYKDFRGILLEGFPYMVYYQVEEQKRLIQVFAVLNTYRDPETFPL